MFIKKQLDSKQFISLIHFLQGKENAVRVSELPEGAKYFFFTGQGPGSKLPQEFGPVAFLRKGSIQGGQTGDDISISVEVEVIDDMCYIADGQKFSPTPISFLLRLMETIQ